MFSNRLFNLHFDSDTLRNQLPQSGLVKIKSLIYSLNTSEQKPDERRQVPSYTFMNTKER